MDDEIARDATVLEATSPVRGTRPPPDAPPAVAGYEIVRLIGHGGMGSVWEAVQQRLERPVALKVHLAASPMHRAQPEALWAEALVAARIGDPSVVRVLDAGYTLDDRPYYAMELVGGTDLGALLADGPLAPRKAIGIAADMARASGAAHRLGIVHRDLKPRNVIVDEGGRARVCDFGIAYDARRGEDRFAGMLAGSPPYMAPEQALGDAITPETDVWAIGVILYEMLTGKRPFAGGTLEELFARIVAATPDAPSARREGIHADLDAVVMRCLEKSPSERFPNAGVLFEALSAVLDGQQIPSSTPYAPKLPAATLEVRTKPRREDAADHLAWSWRLRSSPGALWPHVADTDRFNKAVGLAPVRFTDEIGAGGSKRSGELTVLGMRVHWREYPFEWVSEREHSVFRWYDSGPLSAQWNQVTLRPTEDGMTELRHEIWLAPQAGKGNEPAFVELTRMLGVAVDKFYRALDDLLVAGAAADPFEPPHQPSPDELEAVQEGSTTLLSEGFDPALVDRLERRLLEAPDAVLATMRPYELADAWGQDRSETLDLFIHAAHLGLLEPAWDVICPACRIAHESVSDLARVTKEGSCMTCATSFERDLRDSVELVFSPHPRVRALTRETFCVGSPAKRPHVLVQQVLEPGERRDVTVVLASGGHQVAGTQAGAPWELVASAVGFAETCAVTFEKERIVGSVALVKAGPVRFELHNATDRERTVRVELAGARDDGVSAAAALTHPSFRRFFSSQLLAQGQYVKVRQLAFLFVEPQSHESLFDAVGDGEAFAELARLEALVLEASRPHGGDVVPSPLSMLVVAFPTVLGAVRAALSLRERVRAAQLPHSVAIAVHDGRCLALTRAERPEFFGETLHRGRALLRDCPSDGIALSSSAASDRAAAVAVQSSKLSLSVRQASDGPYAGRRVTLLRPSP